MLHVNTILVDSMTNKKLAFICLTLIIILIIPNINAFSIETLVDKKNEALKKIGSVYGNVAYGHRPGYTAVPFAIVWIGLKRDICNIQGAFTIRGLEIEKEYTFYYTAIGFKTKSIDFYLSSFEPHKQLWPCFTEDDIIKTKNTESLNLLYNLILKITC